MRHYIKALLLFAAFFPTVGAHAQTTGSFDTSITFMGSSRAISLYVPGNGAGKYRLMICLHGLGDTCSNYRNALINGLGWNSIAKTIFVCPEAANRNSDFYTPAGGEAIIAQCIALAATHYNIDSQNVILQGFSLGGRAALRYGLDHHGDFKGLLLNTPAVQGVKEAVNGHPAAYAFNYADASRIPIFMTLGGSDITYGSALDSTYEQLVLNDGIVRYTIVPGLGHSIPPLANMTGFLQFFDTPSHAGKDMEAVKIYSPGWVCNSPNATAGLLMRNTGEDTITSVKFQYTLSGLTKTGTWNGTLLPYQHAIVPLSLTNAAGGSNTLSAQIDTLNQTVVDTVISNNRLASTFFLPVAAVTTVNEGFEDANFPPAGWMLQQAGDFYTAWDADNTIAKTGSQSATTFNTIFFFDNAGRAEGLITPPVDLSAATRPRLSFDVSFIYHRYTPPYFTGIYDFADTLEVLASNDCGGHFTSLYKKGGQDLATYSNPILNPLNLNDLFATPADSNWRKEIIDLSNYPTNGSPVIFKFNYISALGGAINLDNVFIGSGTGIAGQSVRPTFSIYPNPASDNVVVKSKGGDITMLELADMTGKRLLNIAVNKINSKEQSIDVHELPAGIYLLNVYTGSGLQVERLSVVK